MYNPLVLANKVMDEVRIHKENGRGALVDRAWELTNAANARLIAELNRAAFQLEGLEHQHAIVEPLERETVRELAASDAFLKEYEACRGTLPWHAMKSGVQTFPAL
jgi:hypothetical protein